MNCRLDPCFAIFVLECFGIFKALGYCLLSQANKILILTDSQSSLLSLRRAYHQLFQTHPIIYDILELYYFNVKAGKAIHFTYLESHGKVNYYVHHLFSPDIVEQHARKSITLPIITKAGRYWIDPVTPILKHISSVWKRSVITELQATNSPFKSYYNERALESWYHNYNIPRNIILTIIRACTDHTRLNAHMFKIGCRPSPI